jgi:hypothetical protein
MGLFQTRKVGDTAIERWKDGRQGAFCLMFDDSVPTDVTVAIPEMTRRKLVGTFYVNPGTGHWRAHARAWEKELPTVPGVVYANHTMTHQGARSVAQLRDELERCNEVIYRLVPGPKPRLISFGRPGVKAEDWTVTEDEVAAALKPLRLVERPPFGSHGAMIGPKTPEQMVALADAALATGALEFLVFHGVGGDWIATPTEVFVRLLDLLESRRDRLWITDHISAHAYQTAREAATVRPESPSSGARRLRVNLACRADRALYDTPLTLVTQVPADWKRCAVQQAGGPPTVVVPKAGAARYDAPPHGGPVTIARTA